MSAFPIDGVNLFEPQLSNVILKSMKRSFDLFAPMHADHILGNVISRNVRMLSKLRGEYDVVRHLPPLPPRDSISINVGDSLQISESAANQLTPTGAAGPAAPGTSRDGLEARLNTQIVCVAPQVQPSGAPRPVAPCNIKPAAGAFAKRYQPIAAVVKSLPSKWPKPVWHPPWIIYRVISGHLGSVRSIAFDPGNEFFFTGSADRTIKVWETATGKLRLTLTGHIGQIRGLAVSGRHPYLFSAGDDKQVKCWDLEHNKVIRSYHGHLSGVYCLAFHHTQDILMTGGRDAVCRVWDVRTKDQVFVLSGHKNTVCSIITHTTEPEVVTGSQDSTIKLWDLVAGKSMSTLTFHKKSVRALARHPFENTFASASADNIKKFGFPKGEYLQNVLSQQRTIVNSMAVNDHNVLCSAGDNGSLWFWDWKTGHNFQQAHTLVQPGSLDCEAGIYALAYDMTGSRLVTCEADKTIKMWKENDKATPESHPLHLTKSGNSR